MKTAAPPARRSRPKPDAWTEARLAYITEGATAEELAERLGLAAATIEGRIAGEGWEALRANFEDQVRRQAARDNIQKVPDEWKQRFRELEEMAAHVNAWVRAHRGTTICEHCDKRTAVRGKAALDPESLQKLTKAAGEIVKYQRLLMGESTENVQVDQLAEKVLVVVQRWVPEADLERFKDDVELIFGTRVPGSAALTAQPE